MRKLFRFGFGTIVVLFAAVAIFWAWNMPSRDERGLWRSQGHGYIYDIGYFRADMIAVSNAGCTPMMSFPANSWILKRAENVTFSAENEVLKLDVGGVHPSYSNRIPRMPLACDIALDPENPLDTFNVFWAALDENYAFFDLHNVDWNQRKTEGLAAINHSNFKIGDQDENLKTILINALRGLDDGHTLLVGDGWAYTPAFDLPYDALVGEIENQALGATELQRVDGANLLVGWASDEIGLILVQDMSVDRGLFAAKTETEIAQAAMGQALAQLDGAKGIILDNRFNPGGSDHISLAYASWFTAEPKAVFHKSTRDGAIHANPQTISSYSNPTGIFEGPVILLNSRMTESAAEIFTFAMRGLPQVTVMGENTSGGLSDVRGMVLPNGWKLGLSNQIYLSPEGQNFEKIGIPPDEHFDMDADGFSSGQDTLMEYAVNQLSQ